MLRAVAPSDPLKLSMLRYLSVIGPAGVAGSQFVVTYLLLRTLTQSDFGLFAFALSAIQFSFGVSNALFCAPMAVDSRRSGRDVMDLYSSANMLFSIMVALILFVGLRLGYGRGIWQISVFALLANLRWYSRAWAYARFRPILSFSSDFTYSLVLTLSAPVLAMTTRSLDSAFIAFAAAAFCGLAPFFICARRGLMFSFKRLPAYVRVWNAYGRHAMVGVISTEATVNAHSYIVTFISGPASFAPIAAASLLLRGLFVCNNALVDFERPRMAKDIELRDFTAIAASVRAFRAILCIGWLLTLLAALVIKFRFPFLLGDKYGSDAVAAAAIAWLLIGLCRIVGSPESVLLQAAGEFRALAKATLIAGGVSATLAYLFLLYFGPVASLYGVLCGDCISTIAVIWIGLKWRKASMHNFQYVPNQIVGNS